jgi:hypothetical protein
MAMANRAAELASASAWRTYLLLHSDVSEDDDRRTTLHRYVFNLCEAGENNQDALLRAGLLYLRKLDELGEQRDDQLARYRALEEQTNDWLAARLIEEIAFGADSQRTESTKSERRKLRARA